MGLRKDAVVGPSEADAARHSASLASYLSNSLSAPCPLGLRDALHRPTPPRRRHMTKNRQTIFHAQRAISYPQIRLTIFSVRAGLTPTPARPVRPSKLELFLNRALLNGRETGSAVHQLAIQNFESHQVSRHKPGSDRGAYQTPTAPELIVHPN